MKTAIYLFVLIALFNSFSEPHERVKVHIQFYKYGKVVLSSYSDKFIDRVERKTTYNVFGGAEVTPDSIVYTCGSELRYKAIVK